MTPLISVIIPAYNAGQFLEECLNSIANQSIKDFEVVIIDDGSTDDTSLIATRYMESDSRFRLISTTNGGVSRARNIGIDESRGKYISFVDADDALHPQALEMMMQALERNSAQVCITGFKQGKHIGRFPKHDDKEDVYTYQEAMRVALYQKRLLNSPWGVLVSRDMLTPERRFREGTRYEDLDAFYRLYEGASSIVYLHYPYYFYRDNPQSFLNTWSDSRLDVLDVTDRMVEFIRSNYPELLPAALDRRFSAHYNMLLLMYSRGVQNSQALERCLLIVREGRSRALRDPHVRLKNKIGALLSYGGRPFIRIAARF